MIKVKNFTVKYRIEIAAGILMAIICLTDLQIPLGVAAAVPYVAVVLLSLWSQQKGFIPAVAVICSVLTIVGFYKSPSGGELWKVVTNRSLSIFAIWVTAALCALQKRETEALSESKKQFRNLYAHMEAVREEEKARISREVHDELGQMLTALKFDLAWIKRHLPQKEAPALDKMESMSALIDTTIGSVQKITAELRPPALDVLGLVETIEHVAAEFQQRTGIQCWLNLEKNIKLDAGQSTALFRIIQEALTNVSRHAEAHHVHVILKEQGNHCHLEIRDDGRGITQDEISNPNSFGLIGIRERALPLRGEVNYRGSPGEGTTVSVKFSIEAPINMPKGHPVWK